jgi:hypothetical protein
MDLGSVGTGFIGWGQLLNEQLMVLAMKRPCFFIRPGSKCINASNTAQAFWQRPLETDMDLLLWQ